MVVIAKIRIARVKGGTAIVVWTYKCLGGGHRNMGKHVQGRDLALFGESRAIPIFLLTTLLLSSVFCFLIIKSGHMGGG
jgi:hypothetical protein